MVRIQFIFMNYVICAALFPTPRINTWLTMKLYTQTKTNSASKKLMWLCSYIEQCNLWPTFSRSTTNRVLTFHRATLWNTDLLELVVQFELFNLILCQSLHVRGQEVTVFCQRLHLWTEKSLQYHSMVTKVLLMKEAISQQLSGNQQSVITERIKMRDLCLKGSQ